MVVYVSVDWLDRTQWVSHTSIHTLKQEAEALLKLTAPHLTITTAIDDDRDKYPTPTQPPEPSPRPAARRSSAAEVLLALAQAARRQSMQLTATDGGQGEGGDGGYYTRLVEGEDGVDGSGSGGSGAAVIAGAVRSRAMTTRCVCIYTCSAFDVF